jgi:predicted nicotinamide N-methyase
VYDLASGSGLVAIAAAQAGADHVEANDVDPFAAAAIALNARANRSRIEVSLRDALDDPPPDVDIVLTGDAWYNADLAGRVLPWLRRVSAAGIDVIVGDPGRAYLPTDELEVIATYGVRTTSDLEDLRFTDARVFRLRRRP